MDANTRDPAVTESIQHNHIVLMLLFFFRVQLCRHTHTFFSFSLCASNKGCFVGMWSYGVMRSWPEHNALQNGVIMTWLWYHNAGQTMTYFKKKKSSQKTRAGCCCCSASLTLSVCPRGFFSNSSSFSSTVLYSTCRCGFSLFLFVSSCPCLHQCSFLICLVCLPCNSLQWAAGPARESLSYWFNDASSYFTGIFMSMSLNTLSALTNARLKTCVGMIERTGSGFLVTACIYKLSVVRHSRGHHACRCDTFTLGMFKN